MEVASGGMSSPGQERFNKKMNQMEARFVSFLDKISPAAKAPQFGAPVRPPLPDAARLPPTPQRPRRRRWDTQAHSAPEPRGPEGAPLRVADPAPVPEGHIATVSPETPVFGGAAGMAEGNMGAMDPGAAGPKPNGEGVMAAVGTETDLEEMPEPVALRMLRLERRMVSLEGLLKEFLARKEAHAASQDPITALLCAVAHCSCPHTCDGMQVLQRARENGAPEVAEPPLTPSPRSASSASSTTPEPTEEPTMRRRTKRTLAERLRARQRAVKLRRDPARSRRTAGVAVASPVPAPAPAQPPQEQTRSPTARSSSCPAPTQPPRSSSGSPPRRSRFRWPMDIARKREVLRQEIRAELAANLGDVSEAKSRLLKY